MAEKTELGRRRPRRRRKPETSARARLFQIASDQYEDGDTQATFAGKMRAAVNAEPADKPFKGLLLKLLKMLLPFLFKMLSGAT